MHRRVVVGRVAVGLLYARGCVFVDNPKWEVPGKRVLVNGVSTSRHTFERSRRGRVGHGGGLCAADSRLLVGDYVGFGGLPVSRRPSGAERHELVHLWNVGLQGGACPRSRDIHQGSCTSIPGHVLQPSIQVVQHALPAHPHGTSSSDV